MELRHHWCGFPALHAFAWAVPYASYPLLAVDSEKLITASADQTVRIWQLQTGKELFRFQQGEPCRAVTLSIGETMMAYTTDAFMGTAPMIHLVKLELDDLSRQSAKPILSIDAPKGRITRAFWSDLNRVLVTSHDGGFMRKWDSEVGARVHLLQHWGDA